jgi:hypothetical protein
MNKLQMDPPLGGGTPPQFIVKAQRLARPPAPWIWAIYEEGSAHPCRCSSRFYRSAEEAWVVGRAMLDRLKRLNAGIVPERQPNTAPGHDLRAH